MSKRQNAERFASVIELFKIPKLSWNFAKDARTVWALDRKVSINMQSHRNYHLRFDPKISFNEIRDMIEAFDDGTYFIRIDSESANGPFIELHGNPIEALKIAEKLEEISRTKIPKTVSSD
jgi:hypothetical protein